MLAIVLSVLLPFTASDFPLLSSNSSFVTYHRVCNKSKTTCATSGTGTANPFGSHQVFSGIRVARSIFNVLCGVLKDHCLPFCPFFLLAFVVSVLLRLTSYDYLIGIFKLFLRNYHLLITAGIFEPCIDSIIYRLRLEQKISGLRSKFHNFSRRFLDLNRNTKQTSLEVYQGVASRYNIK